jgi:release factor glutamine methyltransferase
VPALKCALEQAFARLRRSPHPERAQLDAETLLLHVLGKNKAWLLAHREEEISPDRAARYDTLVERRYTGEPIQYITGQQEFYGLGFRVTPDVLIPRPETEHLVEKVLSLAASFQLLRIVDVGTGSGAIAIALAHLLPHAEITALDISAAALEQARANAEENRVPDRVRFVASDLLAAVATRKFEIVVSNPPYVPATDRESLSVEVRDFEPGLALFAGRDGLDVYRRLIPAAFAVLEPGGFLVMEIGYAQSQPIAELMRQAGFEDIEFVPDLQGIARAASGRRPSEPVFAT